MKRPVILTVMLVVLGMIVFLPIRGRPGGGVLHAEELAPPEVERLSLAEVQRYQDLDSRTIQAMRNTDLGDYLSLRERVVAAEGQRFIAHDEVGRMGRRALGQSFRLNAVQFDLAEGDCVSFVNRTLAVALAKDWDSYYLLTERLRHKDGVVDYKNRNFFTLGDWLPNNAWLLDDITAELGPADNRPAQTFTHVVRPKVFEERPSAPGSKFTRITFKGSDYESPNKETRRDSYIPRDLVASILRELQTGNVVLVLRNSAGGHLGCDHMGLIIRHEDGRVMMLHSAPPEVREQELMGFLRDYKHVRGFKFLRLREGAKELAAAEVDKIRAKVPRPTAQEVDQRNAVLQSRRLAAEAGTGASTP